MRIIIRRCVWFDNCRSRETHRAKAYIHQIKSNQIKSNQIKSNQIKSNQIKSNQIKSNQIKSKQIKRAYRKREKYKEKGMRKERDHSEFPFKVANLNNAVQRRAIFIIGWVTTKERPTRILKRLVHLVNDSLEHVWQISRGWRATHIVPDLEDSREY